MTPSRASPTRSLTKLDLTCIGINLVVGSSIFLFPGQLAALLGPASALAFAMVGAMRIPVGRCFAKAATRFDRAGGAYLYARAAFGPRAGFAVGWPRAWPSTWTPATSSASPTASAPQRAR